MQHWNTRALQVPTTASHWNTEALRPLQFAVCSSQSPATSHQQPATTGHKIPCIRSPRRPTHTPSANLFAAGHHLLPLASLSLSFPFALPYQQSHQIGKPNLHDKRELYAPRPTFRPPPSPKRPQSTLDFKASSLSSPLALLILLASLSLSLGWQCKTAIWMIPNGNQNPNENLGQRLASCSA